MLGAVDTLISIGEFSRLSGLSPKRLRTYAANGVLNPAAVDPENGYRYYSPQQLDRARLIDVLREAGVPLAEIQGLVRDGTTEPLDAWASRIRADAERKQEALAAARALLSREVPCPGEVWPKMERNPIMQLRAVGRTEVGHVRENNEDAIVTGERLVVVADGIGGHAGGEVASRLSTSLLAATFTGRSLDELEVAVRAANWLVWERGLSTAGLEGMGTTLCAAGVVDGGGLAVANVGDSRAYLAHDGSLRQLTADHTITAELVRRGELTEAEGADHPQRHILTRALGVSPNVRIDGSTAPVVPGDLVLLCSDGLFNEVLAEEIESLVVTAPSPSGAVDALVERALSKGGKDNVSVVVAEVYA